MWGQKVMTMGREAVGGGGRTSTARTKGVSLVLALKMEGESADEGGTNLVSLDDDGFVRASDRGSGYGGGDHGVQSSDLRGERGVSSEEKEEERETPTSTGAYSASILTRKRDESLRELSRLIISTGCVERGRPKRAQCILILQTRTLYFFTSSPSFPSATRVPWSSSTTVHRVRRHQQCRYEETSDGETRKTHLLERVR